MRKITLALLLGFAATSALGATINGSYGWEDGSATILGTPSGGVSAEANVGATTLTYYTTAAGANQTDNVSPATGSHMLKLTKNATGTGQVWIGYVTGLSVGDTVTASFYGWDTTPGLSPSLRVWGHYAADATNLASTQSAGGDSSSASYTSGTPAGWDQAPAYTWTFSPTNTSNNTLVIEARLYQITVTGNTSAVNEYGIDDLSISATSSSPSAKIVFADGSSVAVPEPTVLGLAGLVGLVGLRRTRWA